MNKTLFFILLICSTCIYASELAIITSGSASYDQGDITTAIRHYHTALRDYPDSISARVGLAKCYARKGHYARVDKLVNEVLVADSNNIEALILRGKIYLWNNDEKSIEDFKSVIRLEPDNLQANQLLVSALSIAGREDEAENVYKHIDILKQR